MKKSNFYYCRFLCHFFHSRPFSEETSQNVLPLLKERPISHSSHDLLRSTESHVLPLILVSLLVWAVVDCRGGADVSWFCGAADARPGVEEFESFAKREKESVKQETKQIIIPRSF